MHTFYADSTADAQEVNENFTELSDRFDVQEDWHFVGEAGEPAFEDSWVNYGSPYENASYMKDSMGFVHVRGFVKSGTVGTSATIFTLPAGYRPSDRILMATQSNSALGRYDIDSDGKVIPHTGNTLWFSMANVIFRAEN